MNNPDRRRLSRRDFLKLGGAGLAAAFDWRPPKPEPPSEPEPLIESANKVRFRKDGIITVNDGAIFPRGIFYLPGPETPESWQKLADAGLNTIASWWINDTTLAMAEKHGIFTVARLEYAFPNFQPGAAPDKNQLAKLVKSPSLLAWYGVDEPNPATDSRLSFHQELQRSDPDHPVWTNFFDFPGRPTDTDFQNRWNSMTGTDISGFDVGWTKFVGDNFSYGQLIRQYLDRFRKGTLGKDVKSVWVVLPAHSEVDRKLKSIRFQAVEAIANGATGIFWWDWPSGCTPESCPGYPEKGNGYTAHWDKLKLVAGELSGLEAGLIGTTVSQSVTADRTMGYKITRAADGRHYVFAANGTKQGLAKIPYLPSNTLFGVNEKNDMLVKTDNGGNLLWTFPRLSAEVFVQVKN